jgi:ABC-type molybdate transport system permease subunit
VLAVAMTSFPFMLWTVLAAIEDTDPNVVALAFAVVLRLGKMERVLFRA